MTNSNQKIMTLSLLAAQVKQLGDNELASELMLNADTLVNPQPINYSEYMQIWMLAGGYSQVEPNKAFSLLEESIYKLNNTISAFVKVGEFVDVSGSMIQEGEVQLGMFGGGMLRNVQGVLTGADMVLLNLAKEDFNRTRDLAEKFDRLEVRLMAKLLILRTFSYNKAKSRIIDRSLEVDSMSLSPPPPPPPPPIRK